MRRTRSRGRGLRSQVMEMFAFSPNPGMRYVTIAADGDNNSGHLKPVRGWFFGVSSQSLVVS